jgi:hypothetical protein
MTRSKTIKSVTELGDDLHRLDCWLIDVQISQQMIKSSSIDLLELFLCKSHA